MANNQPNRNNSGQGNANQGGASTSPHPANQPGPDPTVEGTQSTNTPGDTQQQEQDKKNAQKDRDNETSNRQAELDKREKALAEREKALEEREKEEPAPVAAGGLNPAQAAQRETQRQIEQSRKILDGPTKKITLRYRHTNVTAAGAVEYGPAPGSPPEEVEVPTDFADDLLRRDAEHNSYQTGLHQRRENLLFSGTLSGAGK